MKLIITKLTMILFLAGLPFGNGEGLKSDRPLIRTKRLAHGKVVKIKHFPFFVSLITKRLSKDGMFPERLQFCGGSIISKYWVLTVASCFERINMFQLTLSDWFVRSGSSRWNVTKNSEEFVKNHDVRECIIHPGYDMGGTRFIYNMALIKVKQQFGRSAKPIVIAGTGYKYEIHSKCTTVGFGQTKHFFTSSILRKINLKLLDIVQCFEEHRNITDRYVHPITQICAGSHKAGQDICEGDYGGPLVQYYRGIPVLIGISFLGPNNCGNPELHGVYLKTGDEDVEGFCKHFNAKAKILNNTHN